MRPHRTVNSPDLAPAVGFSHAVVAARGRLVFLAGQVGSLPDGSMSGTTLLEQFDRALVNVRTALDSVGARPEHLVQLQIYCLDAAAYRAQLHDLGVTYRKVLGPHYPAVALFAVAGLFDPAALIELVGTAVLPE
jgi:enamine deaminase RidA (YjgF/YER057c/UK114 family)